MRIAYFGPRGTFTEQAAQVMAGGTGLEPASPDLVAPDLVGPELVPMETVPAALAAVRDGTADAAAAPVENSVEGGVPATMDALSTDPALVAVREAVLPVRFSVLTAPGVTAAQVRTVATHPHAAAQVRGWLAEHLPGATMVASTSTAAAAVLVARGEVDAAITAPAAARHYPLHVLATDVTDVPDAVTRFLLLRLPGPVPGPTGDDRTSLLFTTPNYPGALVELLTELAIRGINLTRIESRPTRDRLGEYRFFIDCDGHVAQPSVGEALAALHRRCATVRFLGSYPKAAGPRRPAVPAGVDPAGDIQAGVEGPRLGLYALADQAYRDAADWLAAVRAGTLA